MLDSFFKTNLKIDNAKLMKLATNFAVYLSLFLVMIKIIAYILTNSLAILSSFLDSSADLFSSGISFLAVKYALTPADHEHSFGHGKAESLAGLVQSFVIILIAIFLALSAFKRLGQPVDVVNSLEGIIIMSISLISTSFLVFFQNYVIKKTNSIVIKADSLHYKGDILINLSIIITLLSMELYTIHWLDSVLAIIIAVYLIFNSGLIIFQSLTDLMDTELSDNQRDKIKKLVNMHPQVLGVHDLRTRSSGVQYFIQMHIVLDADMSLLDAHTVSDEVESLFLKNFPNADIIIHQDPSGLIENHRPVGQN